MGFGAVRPGRAPCPERLRGGPSAGGRNGDKRPQKADVGGPPRDPPGAQRRRMAALFGRARAESRLCSALPGGGGVRAAIETAPLLAGAGYADAVGLGDGLG